MEYGKAFTFFNVAGVETEHEIVASKYSEASLNVTLLFVQVLVALSRCQQRRWMIDYGLAFHLKPTAIT